MRIDRLSVKNFRNLADVELRLLPGAVIVGENRAGKSNLLYALRLILDLGLSYVDRQLTREDFWDGLSDGSDDWDPMAAGQVIEASIDIVAFDGDMKLTAALADALLQEDPMRARLTYRFAPMDTGEATAPPKYRGAVYGGSNLDKPISPDVRSYLYLVFLHALRDVENDIRFWRRSPLRPLLEAAAAAASEDDLGPVRQAMKDANATLNDLDVIKQLGASIGDRLKDMVGPHHSMDTQLAAAPDDPLRLIRQMRLFIDGDTRRGLGSASLGTLNVLYLALQELARDSRLISNSAIAHVVMAIEEPEAHLHPHLQRLVFKRLLGKDASSTVLVTTQSPHIASVADPRSLIALRSVDGQTLAAEACTADLDATEWDDIARYLDATRAELVFARRVLLVEGFAEQVLMPQLARSLGMDLDQLGISVCAVHGTHFASYVRFCDALGIPWAVFTDGDLALEENKRGAARAAALAEILVGSAPPADLGVFVGTNTLEHDLLQDERNIEPCFSVLKELCKTPSQNKIDSWNGADPGYEAFMKMIKNADGKGRFAQRLAQREIHAPKYIEGALQYLVAQ